MMNEHDNTYDHAPEATPPGYLCGDPSTSAEAWNAVQEAEVRVEEARLEMERALAFLDCVRTETTSLRNHLAECVADGVGFLNRKAAELREYLTASDSTGQRNLEMQGVASAANAAAAWLAWSPSPDREITSRDLEFRTDLGKAEQRELTSRWEAEDASLQRQLKTLRERHQNASSPDQVEAVRMASRRGAAGRLGELFAERALAPLATSMELQRRTTTQGGEVTITDVVLRDTRCPIRVGRNIVPTGSNIGIEIKCGGPVYLRNQLTHMELQVDGHRAENASFCLLSKDFRRLDRESKRRIAMALKNRRSKVYAILPEKELLDLLVWERITKP